MHPEPTAEQAELKTAARELLDREVTPERLLAWESDPAGASREVRRAVAELGWVGLGVPAAAGGSGAPLVDVACLLEECARGLLPRPLIGQIRAATALADVAPASAALAAIARGERSLALAFDEESAPRPERSATAVRTEAGRTTVHGAKAYVADGDGSDLHLVAAREDEGVSLVLVDRRGPGVETAVVRSFGGDRQAHVRYSGATVVERLARPSDGARALARLERRQIALALAEMVGGMNAVLDMTVAYVKEREQFGQKIAVFQAVRHQVADMGTRATAARHLAWQAITRISSGAEQGHELASAIAYVGQAFKQICWAGHHLHGGAGFVVEHRLRFHSERAQSLCIRWAPEAPALAEIAAALLDEPLRPA
jgi:alkylation response protein AidB-like acyl-CoA dehydrogenase